MLTDTRRASIFRRRSHCITILLCRSAITKLVTIVVQHCLEPYRPLHHIVVVMVNHWQVVRCRSLDWGHRHRFNKISTDTNRCRHSRNVTPFITLRLLLMTYTCLEAAKTTSYIYFIRDTYSQSTFIRSHKVCYDQQFRTGPENDHRSSKIAVFQRV
jgi:hypothetical protein